MLASFPFPEQVGPSGYLAPGALTNQSIDQFLIEIGVGGQKGGESKAIQNYPSVFRIS